MSIFGEWKAATIDNGDTSSDEVDLGRDFESLQIIIPTITSANISFQVAEKTGRTFQALGSGSQVIAAGAGDITTVATIGGFQFIKVISSAAQGAERLIRVRGSRS